MIEIKGIRKSFDDHHVLKDISFSIKLGERVSLLGPGGSGKSIILKLILGLLEPDEGDIKLLGLDMRSAKDDEKRATLKRVGMAFQQGALFDFMTVKENLFFAMEHMTEFSPSEMETKTQALLDGVKLGRTQNMYPHELSGGMQRRVGIARALAIEPQVAIFDEPTSGLDPVTSTIILNMIQELGQSSNDTLQLVATSNVEIAIRFAERVILIHEGKIAGDGNWRDLILNGSEWVKKFLSVRLIGLDREYANSLNLPPQFIEAHWPASL